MALLERLLDKTHHHDVALHAHVFADVKPVSRRANAELHRRLWFAGERPADGPFGADIETEGGVDVGL
jgi:hypothetical protein